jgi:photosynthetic reaction center cytochrome c subunit
MNCRPARILLSVLGTVVVSTLGFVCSTNAQSAPAKGSAKAATQKPSPAARPAGAASGSSKPQMAEDVFKDVRVLKGIPVDEFMNTMGFFAASLSLNCTDCHVSESSSSWARYADETPLKAKAREMVLMVNRLNKNDFGGVRRVTCYTCHRGIQTPKIVPNLAEQNGPPPPEDPNEVAISAAKQDAPNAPTADQVFDKYFQALGGTQALSKLTSFVAKGTYSGFDTDFSPIPVEIYAKAPDFRTTLIHGPFGDITRTYDGHAAWLASPAKPVPLMAITGGDLNGARIDALLSFPGVGIKGLFRQWLVGTAMIDDRPVVILQGTTAGQNPIKLFFDKESGLLVRQVRYSNSMVGVNPTQIDYSDYREVAGIKVPFHSIATWTDGQATTELTDVQPNVAIDAGKFAKPAPAKSSESSQ